MFGWIWVEVMGVLVNVIFLIGFCFVIFLEVIECFIELYEM